jgi:hypothetical protein
VTDRLKLEGRYLRGLQKRGGWGLVQIQEASWAPFFNVQQDGDITITYNLHREIFFFRATAC